MTLYHGGKFTLISPSSAAFLRVLASDTTQVWSRKGSYDSHIKRKL